MKRMIIIGAGAELAQPIRDTFPDWDRAEYSHSYYPITAEPWDILVIASGTLEPVGAFVAIDSVRWAQGVYDNAITPLEQVRAVLPYARRNALVVFFSGPDPNKPAPGYSAYDIGKTILNRMAENLQAECKTVRFVSIGPGYHATKIHRAHKARRGMKERPRQLVGEFVKWCWAAPRSKLGRQIHIDEWLGER